MVEIVEYEVGLNQIKVYSCFLYLVGDDDDGALEDDALPEGDVAADGQVVQLDDVCEKKGWTIS